MKHDEIKELIRKCLSAAEDKEAWSRLDETVEQMVKEQISALSLPSPYRKDVLHAVRRSVHRDLEQLDDGSAFSDWVGTITTKRIDELDQIRELVPKCRSGAGKEDEWTDLMLYVQDVAWPQIERDNSPDDDKTDILQEVNRSVFKSLHQFRDDAPFSHWVACITSHRIADFWRKQRRQQTHETAFNTEEEYDVAFKNLPSGGLDGFQELDVLEQRALVGEAMSKLPENHRMVLEMKEQGLSNDEIAKLIGKTYSAVAALANKAKAGLGVELTRLWKQRFGDGDNEKP